MHPNLVSELYGTFPSANLGDAADGALAHLKLLELLLKKQAPSFTEEQLGPVIERLAELCYYGFQWQRPTQAAPASRLTSDAVQELPETDKPSVAGGLAGRLHKQRSTSSFGSTVSRPRTGPLAQ